MWRMDQRHRLPWWKRPEFRLIAAFVLLSAGLYAVSDVFRSAISRNGDVVAVAGRMRLDLVSTLRAVADLQSRDPQVAAMAVDELTRVVGAVDRQLGVLLEGGEASIAPGQSFTVTRDALPPASREAAKAFAAAWAPISQAAAHVAANPTDVSAQEELVRIARASEATLLRTASAMIGMIGADSLVQARRLGITLIVAAVLGVGFFLLLIWLYSRQLRAAAAARKETDEILATVKSGLFLLDRGFRIGSQYSAALRQILPYGDLAGRSFIELMKPLLDAQTLKTLEDYLGLLFEDRVKESLIETLNPLDRVQLNLIGETGRSERRHVEFSFRRVVEDGRLAYLLVSANDVSDRVELREELERLRETVHRESDRALELVTRLLRLDRGVASASVARWGALLREANEALKSADTEQSDLRELVDGVFRPIHAIKGEAAALGIEHLAQRASEIERQLAELRTRSTLDGSDFLPVTIGLEDLFRQHGDLALVVERLAERSGAGTEGDAIDVSVKTLETLVRQLAMAEGREVAFEAEGLDRRLPERLRRPVIDILGQLVRNAIAHGIEDPRERERRGKPAAARLRVTFQRLADGRHELRFEDDGRGIDFDAVRARAIALGRLDPTQAAKATPRELVRFLFQSGFTTRDSADDHAGRGVGLDLVRDVAARLGATVGVSSREGHGVAFRFVFPGEAAA
jgi:signal transduction histidine kinase